MEEEGTVSEVGGGMHSFFSQCSISISKSRFPALFHRIRVCLVLPLWRDTEIKLDGDG